MKIGVPWTRGKGSEHFISKLSKGQQGELHVDIQIRLGLNVLIILCQPTFEGLGKTESLKMCIETSKWQNS